MTEDISIDSLSDVELLDVTRAGAQSGFTVLWHRYEAEARRYARRLAPPSDADDVVQEAFTQTYQAIVRGHGPRDAFRPYIYQAIRSATYRRSRQNPPTDSEDLLAAVAVDDETDRVGDADLLIRAFRTIGARWREVLWLQEVEDLPASQIGEIMQISPAAVSVLALRAREGLKQAWIQAHLDTSTVPEECGWAVTRISENSRGRLSATNQARFDDHIASCAHCTPLILEAGQVASGLRAVLLPVFLGVSLDQLSPVTSPVIEMPGTLADGFWLPASAQSVSTRRVVVRVLLVLVVFLGLLGVLTAALSALRSPRDAPAPSSTSTEVGDEPSGIPPTRPTTLVPTESAPPSTLVQGDPPAPTHGASPQQADSGTPVGRGKVVFSSQGLNSEVPRDVPSGGELVNTATGHGTVPDGAPPVQQPTAQARTSTGRGPALSLTKTATLDDINADGLATAGETIDYTFSVTNTGALPLAEVTIEDPLAGAVACPAGTLEPGATVRCAAEDPYMVTPVDADRGQVVNTATVRANTADASPSGYPMVVVQVEGQATVVLSTSTTKNPERSWLSTTGASITVALASAFVLATVGTSLVRRARISRATAQ
ncbi:sigma-70 family RNA polymerase sigma factor [Sanguibacter inulinus]|uniref:Sigma-70 family RNA polymerase sigma factor n=1 Tax=Sanguibacter inulinus TaxID=60922 RepID=A0A853ENF4_9MICO|nr:sigma-70 family RNA polymerase sigma factor [Sanguibacter inulinus]MBF0720935.1 sigma-70 family RNA polymerase sigma factor [Sanguibacter inulinus]NYS92080.1 sigma-70 family RNA polymerase sigma factor [Sanguibacter inulinus]